MGSKQKADLRRAQLDAYVSVLKALASKKLDWSKRKLLADLRKHLNVSQDEYLRALDAVLKDPEVTAIRDGTPFFKPQDGSGVPGGSDWPGAFPTPPPPPPRIAPGNPGKTGSSPQAWDRNTPADQQASVRPTAASFPRNCRPEGQSSNVRMRPSRGRGSRRMPPGPRADAFRSVGFPSIDCLVGRKVERFRTKPDIGWVHAVVTDYDTNKDLHCIVHNFNMTGAESWEWVDARVEIEMGRLRVMPGLPIDLKTVVPSVILKPEEQTLNTGPDVEDPGSIRKASSQWCVPFEDSMFMRCLEWSGVAELEDMLKAVVARQQSLLDQLISEGAPRPDGEDPLVSALIEREVLKRREAELRKEGKKLKSSDRQGIH
ncbi:hypothetical protein BSKO_07187 [Bryopsis sp. KO-2023]|nr:hypothetical protein BSKO_07187 [Bryopsis sp. KO-2023]